MPCACFSRSEQARLCVVAQALKLLEDFGKSQIEVALDVLEEDEPWADLGDDARDLRP